MRFNPDFFQLPAEEQDKIGYNLEVDTHLAKRHNSLVYFMNLYSQSPASFHSIDDPAYLPPTTDEIKSIFDEMILMHGIEHTSLITGTSTQLILMWCSGDLVIPYPAWRLALILSGHVTQYNRVPSFNGEEEWNMLLKFPQRSSDTDLSSIDSQVQTIELSASDFRDELTSAIKAHAGDDTAWISMMPDGLVNLLQGPNLKRGRTSISNGFNLIDMCNVTKHDTADVIINNCAFNDEFVLNGIRYKIKLKFNCE